MSGSRPYIVPRTPALAALILLAACSGDAPTPLPVEEDLSLNRECACVTRGDCAVVEMADGEGESRNFQCRWTDESAETAVCRSEDRFKPAGGGWSEWERSLYRFRHLGERGWCWNRQGNEGKP